MALERLAAAIDTFTPIESRNQFAVDE